MSFGAGTRLTAPAATRPDPLGVALMAIAGAAWAVYTLAGRSSREPVAANARNFLWSSPLALLVVLAAPGALTASTRGILLALVSGGVTSGLGYVLWYRVLPRLSVTQAAVAQVGVPVIATPWAVAGTTGRQGEDFRVVGTHPIEWVSAIQELLDDPAARRRYIENARRRLARDYSRETVRDQLLGVIDGLGLAPAAEPGIAEPLSQTV